MSSSRKLLSALALVLLVLDVESSSSSDGHSFDLSGSSLTRVYNSPVYLAEKMDRPLDRWQVRVGPFKHSGIRVTLQDGSQYLIHKGKKNAQSFKTVVTDARHMSSDWEVVSSRDFQGSKTVSDFVSTGGPKYNLLFDNCHLSSDRMMGQ